MTDSCNKHEERYFYDIKLWVWSQISWGAWEANVSAREELRLGRGRGLLLSSVVGTPLGGKTCKTKAEWRVNGCEGLSERRKSDVARSCRPSSGLKLVFWGRKERSNRGQTVWLVRFGVGSLPIARRYFFGVHRQGWHKKKGEGEGPLSRGQREGGRQALFKLIKPESTLTESKYVRLFYNALSAGWGWVVGGGNKQKPKKKNSGRRDDHI